MFLGDGGACFLGFFAAEPCLLLLVRNPEVSPLFALLACVYPIFETLFFICRRWFLRAQPDSMPDGIHPHSLINRRVLCGARCWPCSRSARSPSTGASCVFASRVGCTWAQPNCPIRPLAMKGVAGGTSPWLSCAPIAATGLPRPGRR